VIGRCPHDPHRKGKSTRLAPNTAAALLSCSRVMAIGFRPANLHETPLSCRIVRLRPRHSAALWPPTAPPEPPTSNQKHPFTAETEDPAGAPPRRTTVDSPPISLPPDGTARTRWRSGPASKTVLQHIQHLKSRRSMGHQRCLSVTASHDDLPGHHPRRAEAKPNMLDGITLMLQECPDMSPRPVDGQLPGVE